MQRIALLAAFVVAFALGGGVVADARPADRAAALEAYLDVMDATRVPTGWTGSVPACGVGTESAASLDATREALNALRDFAGIPPVAFDDALNRKALAAALMMDAANDLSHTPGPGWACHTADGDEAAGKSNLSLGVSGAGAMLAYVDDDGVPSLGHRRWALDPTAQTFGSGSTPRANALWVIGGPRPDPAPPAVPEVIAWPPAGHVPWPLVFKDWSAAITAPGGGPVDLNSATVQVTIDGNPAAVTDVQRDGAGPGTGPLLKWRVGIGAADLEADRHIEVTLGNVVVGGVPRTITYTIDTFPVLRPDPTTFSATRTPDAVTVTWKEASGRGLPITGYRIQSIGDGPVIDHVAPADARSATLPYRNPGKYLFVRVVPMNRAGEPDGIFYTGVAAPPEPPSPDPTPTPTPAPGAPAPTPAPTAPPGGGPGPGTVPPKRPPALKIAGTRLTRKALIVKTTLSRSADGTTVTLTVGRRKVRAKVRRGRATLVLRLTAAQQRKRTLRLRGRVAVAAGPRTSAASLPVLARR